MAKADDIAAIEAAFRFTFPSDYRAFLYLSFASATFGQVFFREPYVAGTYHPVANSFSEFLGISKPVLVTQKVPRR